MTIQKKSEHPFSDKYESPPPSMGLGGGDSCVLGWGSAKIIFFHKPLIFVK